MTFLFWCDITFLFRFLLTSLTWHAVLNRIESIFFRMRHHYNTAHSAQHRAAVIPDRRSSITGRRCSRWVFLRWYCGQMFCGNTQGRNHADDLSNQAVVRATVPACITGQRPLWFRTADRRTMRFVGCHLRCDVITAAAVAESRIVSWEMGMHGRGAEMLWKCYRSQLCRRLNDFFF